jgi:hypothetical protein
MFIVQNYSVAPFDNNSTKPKNKQPYFACKTKEIAFSGNHIDQFIKFFDEGKRFVNPKDLEKTLSDLKNVDSQLHQSILDSLNNNMSKPVNELLKQTSKIEFGTQTPFIKTLAKSIFMPVFSLLKFSNFIFKKVTNKLGFIEKEVKDTAEKVAAKKQSQALNAIYTQLQVFKTLKSKSKNNEELKKSLGEYILSNLSKKGKTSYDPTTYSLFNKLLASTLVALFLAADQFNFIMKQTDGDTKKANQQTKQRVIQDMMRVAFSSWIVGAGGSTFRDFNNSSLQNMSVVTTGTTLVYEILTRLTVGVPFLPSSKKQIEENEKKVQNMNNPLGSFFRFINKITGKKSISQRIEKDQQQSPTSQQVLGQNKNVPIKINFKTKNALNNFA